MLWEDGFSAEEGKLDKLLNVHQNLMKQVRTRLLRILIILDTPTTAHGYNRVEIEELIKIAQEIFKDITLNASHPRKQGPTFHRPL